MYFVTEHADGTTRYFSHAARGWNNFTKSVNEARDFSKAEAEEKAQELNDKHADCASWCKYGIKPA